MNNINQQLQRYKLIYKILTTVGTLILVDSALRSVGISFVATLLLYPLLDLFFGYDLVVSILGIYSISWIFLFLLAILFKSKIRELEGDTGIISEPQKVSKEFKIILWVLFVPLAILFLVLFAVVVFGFIFK